MVFLLKCSGGSSVYAYNNLEPRVVGIFRSQSQSSKPDVAMSQHRRPSFDAAQRGAQSGDVKGRDGGTAQGL